MDSRYHNTVLPNLLLLLTCARDIMGHRGLLLGVGSLRGMRHATLHHIGCTVVDLTSHLDVHGSWLDFGIHLIPSAGTTSSRSRSPRRKAHPTAPSPCEGRCVSHRAHHSPSGSVHASPPPEGSRQRRRSPSVMLPGAGKFCC